MRSTIGKRDTVKETKGISVPDFIINSKFQRSGQSYSKSLFKSVVDN